MFQHQKWFGHETGITITPAFEWSLLRFASVDTEGWCSIRVAGGVDGLLSNTLSSQGVSLALLSAHRGGGINE